MSWQKMSSAKGQMGFFIACLIVWTAVTFNHTEMFAFVSDVCGSQNKNSILTTMVGH